MRRERRRAGRLEGGAVSMERIVEEALRSDPSEQREVARLLAERRAAPPLKEQAAESYLSVEGAQLRVLHVPSGPGAGAVRPIVLVPGWGAIPEGFQDFFAVIRGRAELCYLETREKGSSRIADRRRADMSVSRSARDVQAALDALGLSGRDFVLMGTCWGASILLRGLSEGTIRAPTVIAADPMHSLWFPRWVLRYLSPLLPSPVLGAARQIIRRIVLAGMKEKTQLARSVAFVNSADPWKWQHAAEAARDFELYGSLGGIRQEVLVFNGTSDKVHEQRHYPRLAREMPRGRFIYMPSSEDNRERLFGLAALELARRSAAEGLPESLARFERSLSR